MIDEIKWIRLLYCYPEDITDELIDVMKKQDKVLNYIDIPLQHISDDILKKMARKSRKASIIEVVKKLRTNIPDICIRTTFIVGFPGETEENYQELKAFVQDAKLDRVGIFTYSTEENTVAALLEPKIDADIMEVRKDELMLIQQAISVKKNQEMIGRELPVIVEGYIRDEDVYITRCYKDAPDIDGYVFISVNYELMLGEMVTAMITSSNEYDLIGEIKNESTE
jgi:ribosomal protein S12 methylthiotransferase